MNKNNKEPKIILVGLFLVKKDDGTLWMLMQVRPNYCQYAGRDPSNGFYVFIFLFLFGGSDFGKFLIVISPTCRTEFPK